MHVKKFAEILRHKKISVNPDKIKNKENRNDDGKKKLEDNSKSVKKKEKSAKCIKLQIKNLNRISEFETPKSIESFSNLDSTSSSRRLNRFRNSKDKIVSLYTKKKSLNLDVLKKGYKRMIKA